MQTPKSAIFIGIMSGTSLDGLDIAACKFWNEEDLWKFEIIAAQTYDYNNVETDVLKNAFSLSGENLISLHHQYGSLIGKKVKLFCEKYELNPSYIASHGHTIFHQPNNNIDIFNHKSFNQTLSGFTFQLGHGANIAAQSGINTICDFRTSDVAYGGQGAPLVPIGDELLFNEYDYCLNLGGISNISFNEDEKRKAFDIGICNMALNDLAQNEKLKFDHDGKLAAAGSIDNLLLNELLLAAKNHHVNQHSLGYEWYVKHIKPLIASHQITTANKLRTFCEFIALQISAVTKSNRKILLTGGGTKNNFLVECIQHHTNCNIVIPTEQIIDFKEALIFAFLGMLRANNQSNTLSDVTGADKNTIGGCIYLA